MSEACPSSYEKKYTSDHHKIHPLHLPLTCMKIISIRVTYIIWRGNAFLKRLGIQFSCKLTYT